MDVLQLIARISLDTTEYERGLSKAKSDADGMSGAIGGAMSKVGSAIGGAVKLAAAGVTAATGAVTAFAGASVKAGMSFDSAMAQVAATSGKSVDEISNLRDFAQQMGATTAFSATQAAEALNYMALAGYDADQSMEMLPNVLNLAAAGGMELATASDMVTDAQTALGLSAERTSQMVDEMAKVSSTTNTSVSQLGDAMLTVGGTAKTLSGGFYTLADGTQVAYDGTAELSQALGLLADNGIKGSEGGTKLRNMILSLSAPTDKAAAQIQALGVDVFDAEGNMRSLKDVFGDLSAAMDNMTAEDRVNAINTIFNKTDLKAVNALLDTNAERWDEVAEAINGAEGAADAMAKTQLENLAGDVTMFKSALEGVQIAISDGVTPKLREFVKMGTKGLSDITEAIKKGDWEGAFSILGDTLGNAIAKFADMLPKVVDFGGRLISALANGLFQNIDTLIESAEKILDSFMQGMLRASEGGSGASEVMQKISDALIRNAAMFMEVGGKILLNIINGLTENLPSLIETAGQILLTIATGIGKSLPELVPAVVDVILTIVQALLDNVDQLIEAAVQLVTGLATGIINALPVLIEKAPEIISSLVTALVDNVPLLFEAAWSIVIELGKAIIENLPELAGAAAEIIMTLVAGLIEYLGNIWDVGVQIVDKMKEAIFSFDFAQWGKDMLDNFVGGILGGVDKVGEAAKTVAGKIANFLHFSVPDEGPLADADTYGPDLIELLASGIENNVGSLAERIRAALDTVKQVFVTFMEETVALFNGDEGLLINISRALDEWSSLLINETLPNLFTQIRDIVVIYLSEDSEIVSSIRAFFERINMEIESFLGSESGIVTKLTAMFIAIDGLLTTYLYGTIFTRIQTFFTQTTTQISTFVQKTTTDFTTLITKLTQGITKFFDTTVTLVTTKLQEILTAVQRFFTELQTLTAKYIMEKTGLIPVMIDKSYKSIKEATEDLASGEKEGGILYTVSTMFEELIPLIEDSFYGENGIFTMVEELATKIAEVFEGLVEAAYGWGSDMGANFAEGLASQVGAVSAAANALAEAAAAVLKHSVPKKGPLSDDDKWGGHLVENFVNGMLASKGLVTKALDNVFGFMPKAVALIGTDVTAREKEILQKAAQVSVDVSRGLGKEIIRLQEQIALDEIETNRNLTEKKKTAYSARLHELYRELGDAEGEEVTRIEKEIEKIRTKIDFTAEKTEYKTKLKELYEELGSAEEDEVEKIQSNITKLKEDWAQKEEQRNRDTVQSHITALQELKSAYDTELAAIESRQASFAEKMASYGSLFSRVTDSDTGKEMFKLGDLSKDIEQIKNYGDAIEEIKERGLPDGLMENILSMSIDDATDYMNELNKMTNAEYDKYIGLWQEKQQLAASIAQKYYQGEVDALKSNYFDKVLQEAQTLEENMDDVGKDAVKGMKEGMNSKLPSLLKAARKIANSVISEMKATMGIASPSKEMRDQVGIWITRGLADGMEDGMPYLNNATDSLMQTILGVGEGVGDTFIDGLVSGIQEGGEYLKDAVSDIDGVMSASVTSGASDSGAFGGYVQNIYNYSPEPLDASEIARQTRNATQSMVLALRSA